MSLTSYRAAPPRDPFDMLIMPCLGADARVFFPHLPCFVQPGGLILQNSMMTSAFNPESPAPLEGGGRQPLGANTKTGWDADRSQTVIRGADQLDGVIAP